MQNGSVVLCLFCNKMFKLFVNELINNAAIRPRLLCNRILRTRTADHARCRTLPCVTHLGFTVRWQRSAVACLHRHDKPSVTHLLTRGAANCFFTQHAPPPTEIALLRASLQWRQVGCFDLPPLNHPPPGLSVKVGSNQLVLLVNLNHHHQSVTSGVGSKPFL